jgi:hypothetical protein
MRKVIASTCVCVVVALAATLAQKPPSHAHRFIDAAKTRSKWTRTVNIPKVRDQLMEAAKEGYSVRFMAGGSSSLNLLLTRGEAGPRSYQMLAQPSENKFLTELNGLGSKGFRVLPGTLKAFVESGSFGEQTNWVAILEQQSDSSRFQYSVVKGAKEGVEALTASHAAGRVLVGIVGRQGLVAANTQLFFEEVQGGGAPSAPRMVDYQMITPVKTSTAEKEILEAADRGLRVIGASFGYMAVLMAREPDTEPLPSEYRVIAMIRAQTAAKELQAAGVDGFRIAAISENGPEAVFVLRRSSGASERFDYGLLALEEETANEALTQAEGDG